MFTEIYNIGFTNFFIGVVSLAGVILGPILLLILAFVLWTPPREGEIDNGGPSPLDFY